MRKQSTKVVGDDLRKEYDISLLKGGVRGKYYRRSTAGTNLMLIDPDLTDVFPDSESATRAVWLLADTARVATAILERTLVEISNETSGDIYLIPKGDSTRMVIRSTRPGRLVSQTWTSCETRLIGVLHYLIGARIGIFVRNAVRNNPHKQERPGQRDAEPQRHLVFREE